MIYHLSFIIYDRLWFSIYPGPIYCDENGGKLGYETAEDGNCPLQRIYDF